MPHILDCDYDTQAKVLVALVMYTDVRNEHTYHVHVYALELMKLIKDDTNFHKLRHTHMCIDRATRTQRHIYLIEATSNRLKLYDVDKQSTVKLIALKRKGTRTLDLASIWMQDTRSHMNTPSHCNRIVLAPICSCTSGARNKRHIRVRCSQACCAC
jgi:hypothetical protein